MTLELGKTGEDFAQVAGDIKTQFAELYVKTYLEKMRDKLRDAAMKLADTEPAFDRSAQGRWVRDQWNQFVENPKLRDMFIKHFFEQSESQYVDYVTEAERSGDAKAAKALYQKVVAGLLNADFTAALERNHVALDDKGDFIAVHGAADFGSETPGTGKAGGRVLTVNEAGTFDVILRGSYLAGEVLDEECPSDPRLAEFGFVFARHNGLARKCADRGLPLVVHPGRGGVQGRKIDRSVFSWIDLDKLKGRLEHKYISHYKDKGLLDRIVDHKINKLMLRGLFQAHIDSGLYSKLSPKDLNILANHELMHLYIFNAAEAYEMMKLYFSDKTSADIYVETKRFLSAKFGNKEMVDEMLDIWVKWKYSEESALKAAAGRLAGGSDPERVLADALEIFINDFLVSYKGLSVNVRSIEGKMAEYAEEAGISFTADRTASVPGNELLAPGEELLASQRFEIPVWQVDRISVRLGEMGAPRDAVEGIVETLRSGLADSEDNWFYSRIVRLTGVEDLRQPLTGKKRYYERAPFLKDGGKRGRLINAVTSVYVFDKDDTLDLAATKLGVDSARRLASMVAMGGKVCINTAKALQELGKGKDSITKEQGLEIYAPLRAALVEAVSKEGWDTPAEDVADDILGDLFDLYLDTAATKLVPTRGAVTQKDLYIDPDFQVGFGEKVCDNINSVLTGERMPAMLREALEAERGKLRAKGLAHLANEPVLNIYAMDVAEGHPLYGKFGGKVITKLLYRPFGYDAPDKKKKEEWDAVLDARKEIQKVLVKIFDGMHIDRSLGDLTILPVVAGPTAIDLNMVLVLDRVPSGETGEESLEIGTYRRIQKDRAIEDLAGQGFVDISFFDNEALAGNGLAVTQRLVQRPIPGVALKVIAADPETPEGVKRSSLADKKYIGGSNHGKPLEETAGAESDPRDVIPLDEIAGLHHIGGEFAGVGSYLDERIVAQGDARLSEARAGYVNVAGGRNSFAIKPGTLGMGSMEYEPSLGGMQAAGGRVLSAKNARGFDVLVRDSYATGGKLGSERPSDMRLSALGFTFVRHRDLARKSSDSGFPLIVHPGRGGVQGEKLDKSMFSWIDFNKMRRCLEQKYFSRYNEADSLDKIVGYKIGKLLHRGYLQAHIDDGLYDTLNPEERNILANHELVHLHIFNVSEAYEMMKAYFADNARADIYVETKRFLTVKFGNKELVDEMLDVWVRWKYDEERAVHAAMRKLGSGMPEERIESEAQEIFVNDFMVNYKGLSTNVRYIEEKMAEYAEELGLRSDLVAEIEEPAGVVPFDESSMPSPGVQAAGAVEPVETITVNVDEPGSVERLKIAPDGSMRGSYETTLDLMLVGTRLETVRKIVIRTSDVSNAPAIPRDLIAGDGKKVIIASDKGFVIAGVDANGRIVTGGQVMISPGEEVTLFRDSGNSGHLTLGGEQGNLDLQAAKEVSGYKLLNPSDTDGFTKVSIRYDETRGEKASYDVFAKFKKHLQREVARALGQPQAAPGYFLQKPVDLVFSSEALANSEIAEYAAIDGKTSGDAARALLETTLNDLIEKEFESAGMDKGEYQKYLADKGLKSGEKFIRIITYDAEDVDKLARIKGRKDAVMVFGIVEEIQKKAKDEDKTNQLNNFVTNNNAHVLPFPSLKEIGQRSDGKGLDFVLDMTGKAIMQASLTSEMIINQEQLALDFQAVFSEYMEKGRSLKDHELLYFLAYNDLKGLDIEQLTKDHERFQSVKDELAEITKDVAKWINHMLTAIKPIVIEQLKNEFKALKKVMWSV
ncbi:MAG: hypothetical protein HQL30_08940 [Candidatus Omnitrophica bacterium]|nr:hypothetical protein [Candidatus Omnitrophota bacterium]